MSLTTDCKWVVAYFINEGTSLSPPEEQKHEFFWYAGIPTDENAKNEIISSNPDLVSRKNKIVIISTQRNGINPELLRYER